MAASAAATVNINNEKIWPVKSLEKYEGFDKYKANSGLILPKFNE